MQAIDSVESLAQWVEADIVRKSLQSGQPYWTADQVARATGASRAMANRAMLLLHRREVLIRRRGKGTFVGPNGPAAKRRNGRAIYLMTSSEVFVKTGMPIGQFAREMLAHMGDFAFHAILIPNESGLEYVQRIVSSGRKEGHLAGIVATSCSSEILRYLDRCGVPTVVLGSIVSNQFSLPFIDKDQKESGHLLARHLIEKGHTKLGFLMVAQGLSGNTLFYEGICEALAEANLPPTTLKLGIWNGGEADLADELRVLLSSEDRPTGLIANGSVIAHAATQVARDLALAGTTKLEIVYTGALFSDCHPAPWLNVWPAESSNEMIRRVGAIMKELIERGEVSDPKVILPVSLLPPGETRGNSTTFGNQEQLPGL